MQGLFQCFFWEILKRHLVVIEDVIILAWLYSYAGQPALTYVRRTIITLDP